MSGRLRVLRRHPLLSLLLLANLGLAALVLLELCGGLGLGFALALLVGLLLLPPEKVVRGSPLAFAIAFGALGAGEIALRLCPAHVGGGGGGNPALRQLYAGLYSYNSLGLRGPELAPGGAFRILAVGDSFTFGQGVAEPDTWPARLQALLGSGYEVVNGGSPGRDLYGAAEFLREQGLALSPQLVVLQTYANDVRPHLQPGTESAAERFVSWLRAPLHESYVLFFLRERCRGRADVDEYFADVADGIAARSRGWRDFTAALEACGTLVSDAGLPLVVALFPHPGPPRQALARIHAAMLEHGRLAGLRVVDLAPAVGALPPDEQRVSDLDHHGSAAFNAAMARGLLDELQAARLLPP